MQTITRQGTVLTVHLAAIHRVPAGEGVCLVGGTYCQELGPDEVRAIQGKLVANSGADRREAKL
jgi:hypothetical protein